MRALVVLAVSGSRADWGYLAPPLALMRQDNSFVLKLAVTGQHLVKTGSDSLRAIMSDGFEVDARVDMLLQADTAIGVTKSIGLAVLGFADVFARLQPDLLFVVGDRYETLAAVQAALVARVPVAHLVGGDVTEGAFDEAIRHSITKMSHLHFVTNAESATRVRQLGEDPARVYNVGSTSLDWIRREATKRDSVFEAIGLRPCRRNAVVTFHPVTLETDSDRQCQELLAALGQLGPDMGLVFTGVNADPGGSRLAGLVREFVQGRENAVALSSLGSQRYFSLLSNVDLVIGNSSSGLYEVPSFGIPTVNIGNRQAGRIRAASVIDCAPERAAILAAVEQALELDCSSVDNPYGDGHASERIVAVLKEIGNPSGLLKKRFHMLQ
jgi:UDP-N-acetylglucosamine 2-epimerase (non-hydrolysing)/GDP/UDP-N,N'-diacetylbacillosamine 2-epimerase (hydrolysing)